MEIICPSKLKERHTHYPVPSYVNVSEELEKIIEGSANVYICMYEESCGPKSSLRGAMHGTLLDAREEL